MYSKEAILDLMTHDQGFLEGCIVRIYEKQTEDEKHTGETTHDNGIGFSGCDSRNGTYMAEYILKGVNQYRKTYGQNLSGRFLEKARKFMPKYAGQLVKIFAA